jgi:hypothetical protein
MKKKIDFAAPAPTLEIPVGNEVGAVEAVGKIFLEEVKVSLA